MKNIFRVEVDNKRVFGLDILRALAILFVIIEHECNLLPGKLLPIINYFVFDGVSIFFVLSGFLIGGILIKLIDENGITINVIKNFWIRRWFRTLPNYFLILLILCTLHFFFDDNFTFRSIGTYFIFSQNIAVEHPFWFFPEAWSLSVEEWFYLMLPILVAILTLILKKSYQKGLLFTCIIVIVVVTLFRYYRYLSVSINDINSWDILFRKQVITRLDSLMFGVIGAYFCCYYRTLWIKYKKPLFFGGILLFILTKFILPKFTQINDIYFCVFSFSLISIATLSLLPYLSELKSGKGLLYKTMTYISVTSYSMYLLNLSIIQGWIIKKIPWNSLTNNRYIIVISKNGIFWFLLISLSILLYKYYEVPMTSLRERKDEKPVLKTHE